MITDFNLEAHLSALLFLATAAGLVALALIALVAWWMRRPQLARVCVTLAAGGATVYLLLLAGFSLPTKNVVLEPGAEKHFCELDCHLAYSITAVERPAALGEGAAAVQPHGQFVVVRMKVRFDETTTTPQRPRDAALNANPRRVRLLTKDMKWIEPSDAGQAALGVPRDPKPLIPGESAAIAYVFDVPANQQPWLLLMTQSGPEMRWMIGYEDSWVHGKSAWKLD